ncbi:class I SAM-dependent methyltransferase [Marinilabiliaceae bacterium A049]|nr:class I SAM-dependent methyltransferase [Marinilabiliaceae bacterium A049]
MGQAALDYMSGKRELSIRVRSNIAEDDFIPVDYLFRSFNQMPEIEQKALMLCKGYVLDIGAGTGSHALYLQQKGLQVDCIDTSEGCKEAALQRGVTSYYQADFYQFDTNNKYDTLLLMMNGIGLAGNLKNLDQFLQTLKKHLNPGGQVMLDSSDLRYLFIDEDSYMMVPMENYYGEVIYTMKYKNHKTQPFPWLFIDPALLEDKAIENGFTFEKLFDGPHYDYLAKLILKP